MAIPLANLETPVWRALVKPWLAALALSALLVGAGARWPIPLLQQAWAQEDPGRAALLALALVLVPPGLMAALLIVRHRARGESIDCAHGER
jgi:hypothetical protein